MTQTLDSIANDALGAHLKAHGFRKQGRTWRRRVDDGAIQVINVQGSMFSTGVEGRCALNIAIYIPALAEALGIGRITDAPTEADCHLRRRAAMLRADKRDTWFEFQADDPVSVNAAVVGIRELYTGFGEPWLHEFSSLRAAREELVRTGQAWWAAAASLCYGDRPDAALLLRKAIDEAPQDIAPHLRRWGQQRALL
jgi:hypothetical protein